METYDPLSKAWDALSAIYRRSGTDVQTYLSAMEESVSRLKSRTGVNHQVRENSPQTRSGSR